MNNEKFLNTCAKIISGEHQYYGIGTLGENTLHAILKHYFEPDEQYHEIKVGRHYADIRNSSGIIEIQTRQFNKLCGKLKAFLPNYPVTLVYPVAHNKWLLWLDENSVETTKKRLSPKRGSAYEAFFELYRIKTFLTDKNLSLCIILLDIEEYRLLNGWSEDRKKGSWRYDRISKGVYKEVHINCKEDYSQLIPDTLPAQFTSKDFARESGLKIRHSQTSLTVLNYVGAVERVGKQGNMLIYKRLV